MIEDQLLTHCHKYLWNNYPDSRLCCWHVANERKTNAIHGGQLKAKGVIAGVPDYVINHNSKTYYIEFKTDIGTITHQQFDVHKALLKQGFVTVIIRNFDDFKQLISTIYGY
jgi:hypothetical protein